MHRFAVTDGDGAGIFALDIDGFVWYHSDINNFTSGSYAIKREADEYTALYRGQPLGKAERWEDAVDLCIDRWIQAL